MECVPRRMPKLSVCFPMLLEQLGCFAIVLEKIPAALAAKVAQAVSIPVIGIGAGADVDGQILVV